MFKTKYINSYRFISKTGKYRKKTGDQKEATVRKRNLYTSCYGFKRLYVAIRVHEVTMTRVMIKKCVQNFIN